MFRRVLIPLAFASAVAGCSPEAGAQTLKFDLPVACRLGETCEIQNYVDADPATGAARDFRGGTRSYDGHSGTDIRIPTLAAQRNGVEVLAAAEGQVLRARDGMADVSVRTTGLAAVDNRECGNGVVIGHEGGLETQYCHLANGSIRVKAGDVVARGQPIGRIGLSGETEYPHLHFTVRRGAEVLDPFVRTGGADLWRTTPAYKERSVLNTGFHAGPVTMAEIDAGPAALTSGAPAMVAYVRAIGLRAGDEQEITLKSPSGEVLATNRAKPLSNPQAQSMVFTGKKRPGEAWPAGVYVAEYKVRNGGQVVLDRAFRLTLSR
jgi:hypothetical protein